MPFISVAFLFAFLPVFLVSYFVVPRGLRKAVALGGSVAFYAWGAPQFFIVLLGVSALDFAFSRALIGPKSEPGEVAKRIVNELSDAGRSKLRCERGPA
jgi:alginate O-acetyltransferase complex protein AlgI